MTSGRTFSVLLKFSLPMLLSVAFQQLYNIVDSVIAGNFVSDMALGAIGASYPVTMIFMAVATGGSVGASVVVARLFGSKNYTYMKTAINTALVSFAAIAGVLTVTGCALCSPMLTLLGTPDDIFADSDIYLRVYVLGLLFLFIYNACNGIFTALGDSKTPLFFLIASSLGNIGLDLLFVIVFQMGVAGVAWATFAAQGAAGIAAFFVLFRAQIARALWKEMVCLYRMTLIGKPYRKRKLQYDECRHPYIKLLVHGLVMKSLHPKPCTYTATHKRH